jgi:hypothetical protein
MSISQKMKHFFVLLKWKPTSFIFFLYNDSNFFLLKNFAVKMHHSEVKMSLLWDFCLYFFFFYFFSLYEYLILAFSLNPEVFSSQQIRASFNTFSLEEKKNTECNFLFPKQKAFSKNNKKGKKLLGCRINPLFGGG